VVNLELKGARARLGLTQSDMAQLLKMTTPAYCQKENGQRPFTQVEIAKLSDMLKLTPEQLVKIFFADQLNANDKSD